MSVNGLKWALCGLLSLSMLGLPACTSTQKKEPQAVTGRTSERQREYVQDKPGPKVHGRSLQ